MKRKIYSKLLEWKTLDKGKTALLVEGARRVGKSYIVEEFAKNEYRSYVILDFKEAGRTLDPIKEILDYSLRGLDDFFQALTILTKTELFERESLIIFDEVQEYPRAREAIKFLVKDGRYDYIETGSLISIRENTESIQIPSEETSIEMYPMDFEEFLWATDREPLYNLIRKRFQDNKGLEQAFHREAMIAFRQYLIVGGMPQSVKEYAESKDFIHVDRRKRDILKLYQDDIKKHDLKKRRKVQAIFDEIPAQLSKHEKRFVLSTVEGVTRFDRVAEDLIWLEEAKLVNIAYKAGEPNIGLRLTRDGNSFKCYLADTGLLISMAFDESKNITSDLYRMLMYDTLSFNEGMILENAVAQMLTATGRKNYYFSSYSAKSEDTMEIDFLITKNNLTARHNIIPIEVKSGKGYAYASLEKFKTKYKDYCGSPYIIHNGEFMMKNGITYLPLYMTPLL